MEGKVTYTRLKSMYKKIQKSMNMSNKKQKNIQKLEKKLYEEKRPAMVDVHREQIEIKKNEKEEFDDMTRAALLDVKKQILILKEKEEKKFQKSLLKVQQERNDNKSDIIDIIEKTEQEELEELEELREKMNLLRSEHEKFLDELEVIENEINRLAIQLGVDEEIDKITIEDAKETEKEAIQRAKEERKNKKEEKEKTIRDKEEKEKKEKEKEEEENAIKREEEFKKRLKELQIKEKEIKDEDDIEIDEEDLESIRKILGQEIENIEEYEELQKKTNLDTEESLEVEFEPLNLQGIDENERDTEEVEKVKFEPLEETKGTFARDVKLNEDLMERIQKENERQESVKLSLEELLEKASLGVDFESIEEKNKQVINLKSAKPGEDGENKTQEINWAFIKTGEKEFADRDNPVKKISPKIVKEEVKDKKVKETNFGFRKAGEEDLRGTTKPNKNIIKIEYNSNDDMYILKDENLNKNWKSKRVSITDLSEFAEKRGLDIEDVINVDPCIVEILEKYDEVYHTDRTKQYIKEANLIAKSKDERKSDMENMNIYISYDIKDLYKLIEEDDEYKPQFSKKERKELLSIVNKSKELGLANVKKGFYVSLREKIDNIIDKIINIKNELLLGDEEQNKDNKNKGSEGKEGPEEMNGSKKFKGSYECVVDHDKAIKNLKNTSKDQEKEI